MPCKILWFQRQRVQGICVKPSVEAALDDPNEEGLEGLAKTKMNMGSRHMGVVQKYCSGKVTVL